jgi:hypothetical protein
MSNEVLLLSLLLVFIFLALCVNTLPAHREWRDEDREHEL